MVNENGCLPAPVLLGNETLHIAGQSFRRRPLRLRIYSGHPRVLNRMTNPALHCGDFVGPANVAYCQQRTYSVAFRTSRYAKYFVFESLRVNARQFVIDRSSVQVRSSAPVFSVG